VAIAGRIILALAVVAMVPLVRPPDPVLAACGTSWDSRRVPPKTIRVHRHGNDTVDVVRFKRYVQVVMASEWPSYLPRAAREVGATAVKQYAWYHALDGHHRPSYRTRDGVCYDVKNTTADQLYMPYKVNVDDRIRASVNATWGLSLRKGGRFFMTGYRTGSTYKCGADVDGRLVYARSVIGCARRGKSRAEIQRLYYGRRLDFVWTDRDPTGGDGQRPTVTSPRLKLRGDASLGGRFARVSWSGSDASGIARYELQRSIDGGAWKDVSSGDTASATAHLGGGHRYRYRVRARDASGLWSGHETSPVYRTNLAETDRVRFRSGEWRTDQDPSASGSRTRYTHSDGARATFTFTGRSIAYVSPRAPGRGQVRITINGRVVATVDLASAEPHAQSVVFVKNWRSANQRTIGIEAIGTDRIDIDAFMVVR
jgi:hypothetical protein